MQTSRHLVLHCLDTVRDEITNPGKQPSYGDGLFQQIRFRIMQPILLTCWYGAKRACFVVYNNTTSLGTGAQPLAATRHTYHSHCASTTNKSAFSFVEQWSH